MAHQLQPYQHPAPVPAPKRTSPIRHVSGLAALAYVAVHASNTLVAVVAVAVLALLLGPELTDAIRRLDGEDDRPP